MFFDRDAETGKHGGKLPHWQQDEVMQFVTFRLRDAMPQAKLARWKEERDLWLEQNPEPWGEAIEKKYHARFTWKLEEWLDQGVGSCLLRDGKSRQVLEDCLMLFQGERVIHETWVIMPNHVHLLFTPKVPIEELVKAWKGVSAREIGKGQIWQKGYRDTMIRDVEHFANAVKYIRRNPMRLNGGEYTLWESARAQEV